LVPRRRAKECRSAAHRVEHGHPADLHVLHCLRHVFERIIDVQVSTCWLITSLIGVLSGDSPCATPRTVMSRPSPCRSHDRLHTPELRRRSVRPSLRGRLQAVIG